MKQSRQLLIFSLIAVLTLSFAFATTASAKMVKKVDNFILFVDHSGSMAMTHADEGKIKMDMAKDVLQAMNKAIPELDFTSAMFTFSPFQELSKPGAYNKTAITNATAEIDSNYEIFGRQTALGEGKTYIEPVVEGLTGKTALILFTDGLNNAGTDPVVIAERMKKQHGDNLCVHIVSLADKPQGMQTIAAIRKVFGDCTVGGDYDSLMKDGAMDKFVQDVFFEEVADAPPPAPEPAPAPAPAPVPAPEPAPAPMAKETVTFSLNFGFDKADITDEMIPVMEEVQMTLEEDPNAMFEVQGHTDASGPEAYNQMLSEKRAKAVQKWLVDNGVPADKLEAKGYGESMPKYDNATRDGRKLNRRVEIVTK